MKREFIEKTLERKVRDILAETLMTDKRNIRRENKLVDDLGADSIDFVEIVMELEKTFDITIRDDEAEQLNEWTVGDLYKFVEGKL
jgi:acyl carrier protein